MNICPQRWQLFRVSAATRLQGQALWRIGCGRRPVVSFEQDLFLLRFGQGRTGVVATAVPLECGFEADRDWNAAKNLESLAASSAVSACGEERSGAARKSRVKRSSVKQEPNLKGELCAA
jgi:hypothetical protein